MNHPSAQRGADDARARTMTALPERIRPHSSRLGPVAVPCGPVDLGPASTFKRVHVAGVLLQRRYMPDSYQTGRDEDRNLAHALGSAPPLAHATAPALQLCSTDPRFSLFARQILPHVP